MNSVTIKENVFFYMINGISLGITADSHAVTGVFFGNEQPADSVKAETSLIATAARQIEAYCAGKLKKFTVPLTLSGTAFQMDVWRALQTIPYGETRSYKDIAVFIGRPKAVRAVGMANNRNPVVIMVPCHRVIGHDGSLTGYGGGLLLKQYLLELERSGCQ